MQRFRNIIVFIAGVGIAAVVAQAAPSSLKTVRFGGVHYVTVSDVARYYGLGRNRSGAGDEARYHSTLGTLALEGQRRDIQLNGVAHWLSAPVLEERGRLWVSSTDVLKVIDPVLRSGRSRVPAQVRTIVIDPGHGGADRGARGVTAIEKELTLDMARRVKRLLEAAGLRVALTRTKDRTLTLDDRVEFSRDQRADLFVSVHFNSGGAASGIETYCLPPAGAPSTASPFRSLSAGAESLSGNRSDDQNVWLAHCVQKSLLQETGASDRGVRRARFAVLRDVKCPAILVECGFISNRTDERRILSVEYRQKLAKAIAAGILQYRTTTAEGVSRSRGSVTRWRSGGRLCFATAQMPVSN
jgi:N-acetylmuramoyl-L-alanine amidase